ALDVLFVFEARLAQVDMDVYQAGRDQFAAYVPCFIPLRRSRRHDPRDLPVLDDQIALTVHVLGWVEDAPAGKNEFHGLSCLPTTYLCRSGITHTIMTLSSGCLACFDLCGENLTTIVLTKTVARFWNLAGSLFR